MKTFLIVFAILILLGIVIFLLIRKPEKVDNVVTKQDDDEKSKPDVKNDVLKSSGSSVQTDETKYDKGEVHIPEHCKIEKYDEPVSNKYFFNIHKYTSKKGKEMFCVVCSAVINNDNYRIIVKNSYYPYIKSYTITIADRIRLMFENNNMTVDEFIKLGSTNFVGVGDIVESL